jgi:hypothetical protein
VDAKVLNIKAVYVEAGFCHLELLIGMKSTKSLQKCRDCWWFLGYDQKNYERSVAVPLPQFVRDSGVFAGN